MDDIILEIEKFLKERNWDRLSVSDVAKSISIEAAELLELFQWGNYGVEDAKKDKAKMKEIEMELADVLIYTLDMARLLGIDPKKAIKEKLEYNAEKYPVELVKNARNKEKDGGSAERAYYEIKQKYRSGESTQKPNSKK